MNTDFSDEFLYKIYELFDEDKGEYDVPCYDRKTNKIIRKDFVDIGRGEFIIDYEGTYDRVNKHLTEEYGEECANFFANILMNIVFTAGSLTTVTMSFLKYLEYPK